MNIHKINGLNLKIDCHVGSVDHLTNGCHFWFRSSNFVFFGYSWEDIYPRRKPGIQTKSNPSLNPKILHPRTEEELIHTFLSHCHILEQALVKLGFVKTGHTPESPQADWVRFALHIENLDVPEPTQELKGAMVFLLMEEENRKLREQRLKDSSDWENASPQNNIVWMTELVLRTRNSLEFGLPVSGRSTRDLAQITAALLIVHTWSHMDARVENLLSPGM